MTPTLQDKITIRVACLLKTGYYFQQFINIINFTALLNIQRQKKHSIPNKLKLQRSIYSNFSSRNESSTTIITDKNFNDRRANQKELPLHNRVAVGRSRVCLLRFDFRQIQGKRVRFSTFGRWRPNNLF